MIKRSLVISKSSDGETMRVVVHGVTLAEVSMSEWSRALVAPSTHEPGSAKVIPLARDDLTDAQRTLKETLLNRIAQYNTSHEDHKEGA